LVAGYEGLKTQTDKIPADAKLRLVGAVQRLIDLHTARDMPEEAAKWQKELESLKASGQSKE
jgi:hypothetical protein